MIKLLLVEDEASVREPLTEQLTQQGFAVVAAANMAEARKVPLTGIALVILDWELPDGQGLDLLREWRAAGSTIPVLMLTARAEVSDKVFGLEMGADDYLTKPFAIRELVARIRTRLRQPVKPASDILEFGNVRMDLGQRIVTFKGQAVELAKMEFELLRYFLQNPDRALARDEILDKVWGLENFPTSRTVDTHVLTLRKKLVVDLFETLHGFGYRFRSSAA